ncbi:hypothetical protein PV783_24825 [Chitinophaga sp. CC14]|uniref:MauE/DoxX family redox-associated membrane protein n=1 Tax=Chitinophaga sp. CC14 TaxID=3029199 RepID=UPI003B765520
MKIKKILLEIFIAILVILFAYTASIKLLKFEENVMAMKAQPLVPWLQRFLIYGVPISEIVAIILLAIPRFRRIGLFFTAGLLFCFTGYVVLVNLNYYGRIPCSCGGVIRSFTWQQHLAFNSFFIIIAIAAIWLENRTSKHQSGRTNTSYSEGRISLH